MTDQVHLELAVRIVQLRQDTRERAAVTGMPIRGRVIRTVVDRAADEVGVQLAGAVPVAGDGADRRGVDLIAGVVEDVAQAAEAAPVVQAEHLRATPAEQAVHHHDRIVVAVGRQQLRQVRVRQFVSRGRMVGIKIDRVNTCCEAGHAKHHRQHQNGGEHFAPRFLHENPSNRFWDKLHICPLFYGYTIILLRKENNRQCGTSVTFLHISRFLMKHASPLCASGYRTRLRRKRQKNPAVRNSRTAGFAL